MGNGWLLGSGIALPQRRVANSWFEERIDTSDEWIRTRTGISERRFAEIGEKTSDYALAAARQAMQTAGLGRDDVGMVVVATSVPDMTFPSVANQVIESLGLTTAFGYDVGAACCGFVFAMSAADSQIRAGLARNALVIGADIYSSLLDMNDRSTCVLFGDGAGALAIGPSADGRGVLHTCLRSVGGHIDVLGCRGGGTAGRTSMTATGHEDGRIFMDGPAVFRLAVQGCCNAISAVLDMAGLKPIDVAHIVPHQANMRILAKIADHFDYPIEHIETNLKVYGNTAAASVPIALHEALKAGRIVPGDLVLLVAAGAGFNWGAILLRV
jgi:3-oxoacyl-[acyl-carrier-protein] synthase-3